MTSFELKSTFILSFIFACRMLGLFMVLPILALYVPKIPHASPALIGVAAGIYGFSQALLQLPFGVLSDYWGRRGVIIGGLVIFAAGSLIAAFSQSIWGLIIGRAIQGAGAIGSPLLALAADLTREQVRTRAMALIGITIGFTFIFAFLLGPWLDSFMGLDGIFMLSAVFAGIGIVLLSFVKTPSKQLTPLPLAQALQNILQRRALWALYFNIFIIHLVLTALFLILPTKILAITELSKAQMWQFYAPVLIGSILIVLPFLRHGDERQAKGLKLSFASLSVAMILMDTANHSSGLMLAMILFFAAFNFLEACLPALVSKLAPEHCKGTAMGLFSCSQFLGMFMGGIVGGFLLQSFGMIAVVGGCLLLTVLGLLTSRSFSYSGEKPIQVS